MSVATACLVSWQPVHISCKAPSHTHKHSGESHNCSSSSSNIISPHPPSPASPDKDHGHSHHQNHHHHHHHHNQSHDFHSNVDANQVASRPRESPYPMFSVDEAVAMVMENTPVLHTQSVNIKDALGRYLADTVYAAEPLPPFPASIKDGYAVRAEDGAGIRMVLGEASAGDMDPRSGCQHPCFVDVKGLFKEVDLRLSDPSSDQGAGGRESATEGSLQLSSDSLTTLPPTSLNLLRRAKLRLNPNTFALPCLELSTPIGLRQSFQLAPRGAKIGPADGFLAPLNCVSPQHCQQPSTD
ncbi:ribonuclease t2 [Plakobranchus ocellatus]|uniref:Ribonuclease t2 n=1 Tax=Plakobranchus ocellatus TaxID=259542 RepID=A0AAV3YJD2_9GAST|nr:ribonuclease t2 [Plakobranchus ocellatus]